MYFDGPAGDSQSQTKPNGGRYAGYATEKWFENRLQLIFGDAGTPIRNGYQQPVVRLRDRNDHHSDPRPATKRIYLFLPVFTFLYPTLTRIYRARAYSSDNHNAPALWRVLLSEQAMKPLKRTFWIYLLLLTGLWWLADQTAWSSLDHFFRWRAVWMQYSGVLGIGVMSLAMLLAIRPVVLEPYLGGLDKMYRLHIGSRGVGRATTWGSSHS